MIIDSHLHFSLPSLVEDVLEALDLTNCQYGNLVAQINMYQSSETLDCLFAKAKSNHRLYTYGSLDPTEYIKRTNMGENLIEHVKNIMKCGCDGVKMLEGKPDERKRFPIPDFDCEEFDKLFSYLEKKKSTSSGMSMILKNSGMKLKYQNGLKEKVGFMMKVMSIILINIVK